MKKNKFEQDLYETLEKETPDVLSKIKQDPRFRVPTNERMPLLSYFRQYKVSTVFSSLFVLGLFVVAILFSSTQSNEVIASTVSIDINPSVELLLNEDDEIIDIEAINEDGELLIDNHNRFKGLSIDTAIRILVDNAIAKGFIEDSDPAILVNVVAENASKKALVQEKIEVAFTRESMRHQQAFNVRNMVQELTENVKEQAKNHQMTGARYRLIETILETTNVYTFEDLETLNIHDLFAILNEENGDDSNFPPMGPRDDMPGPNMTPGNND